ncbi:CPBP family intramembrane glutamic endopeptidase [Ferruginibacter albus]|uniref:CPBP family intramembrane glutamic endopeptidase n=1 Tax=Ferruginibacter albus TaxID=2875540 RepID=UPI001CC746E5|nr:CPBP family intramembrane glutamic endopeptidase [Ferruginibacter albus]UAY51847.1 CPBP family intramembrane metalloprotease [Ferruginibacter albus]
MQYKNNKGYTGWAQLAFLFLFIAIGIVLWQFTAFFLENRLLGTNGGSYIDRSIAMSQALMRPENATYAQLFQIGGTFFLLFFPSLLFILVCYKKMLWGGFSKHFSFLQVVIAFFIFITANIFAIPFEKISKIILAHFPYWDSLAKQAEHLYNEQVTTLSILNTWPQFLLAIFIMAFLPALFEEFFFRGVIQNLLVRWLKKPVVAIVIASLLFSLIHASYYLFISRFILGYVLGLLFYQSKNIWVNISAHFFNNLIVVTQLFILNISHTAAKPDLDATNPSIPAWSLIISLPVLIGLFIQFKKASQLKRQNIEEEENKEINLANTTHPAWH